MVAWPLDEASGTRYPDYGGSAFNLTDVNTVGSAAAPTGIGGVCASFEESTSEYLYATNTQTLALKPLQIISVSAWVYFDSFTDPYSTILGRFNIVGSSRQWILAYDTDPTPDVMRFRVSSNGTSLASVDSSVSFSLSTWYHVVAICDGAQLAISVNGTVDTTPYSSGIYTGGIQATMLGAFGNGGGEGTSSYNSYHDGRISQALIWSRAITSDEITYLYNSGNGRPLSDWLT